MRIMAYVLLVEDEALIAALLAHKIEGLSDRKLVVCNSAQKAFALVSKE
jgi:CheY-like chemotaxis protein